MFFIQFLRFLRGWIWFEAEGGFPERMLNLAARADIALWNTCRQGIVLKACCFARDYKKLRPFARKAGLRLRVKERHGVPFFLHRYHARAGIVVGFAAYAVLLLLLSQRIWVVDVVGNDTVPDKDILEVVEPMGVEHGRLLDSLDIPAIQLTALQKIPGISWLTVNLSGSVARVEVKERTLPPEPTDPNRPSNIKAARDGRIIEFSVYGGQAMVQNGDAVTEGMLLVSGIVESNTDILLRRSQAKIIAETNRTLTARIPLTESKLLPTGREIFRPTFEFFGIKIPLYTDGPIEGEYSLREQHNPLTANGLPLPLAFHTRLYVMMEPAEIHHTPEEAEQMAQALLAQMEQAELGNAKITSATRRGELMEDAYILYGEYQCVEDIGVEEQILLD